MHASEVVLMIVKSCLAKFHITLVEHIEPIADKQQSNMRKIDIEKFPAIPERLRLINIIDMIDQRLRQWNPSETPKEPEDRVQKNFNKIRRKLFEAKTQLDKARSESSLSELWETDFVSVPFTQAINLYQWIKGNRECGLCSGGGKGLCTDLITFCDIKKYRDWQDVIGLALIQAFSLKGLYLSHHLQATGDERKLFFSERMIENFSQTVQLWIEEINDIMTVYLKELKVNIILAPEPYKLQFNPWESDFHDSGETCGLGMYLESILRERNIESDRRDKNFLSKLRKRSTKQGKMIADEVRYNLTNLHGHFVWSVAVITGYQSTDCQIQPKYIRDVYFRKFGRMPAKDPMKSVFNSITSNPDRGYKRVDHTICPSKGSFGCLVCFLCDNTESVRDHLLKRNAIIVFWIDPEVVTVDQEFRRICEELRKDNCSSSMPQNTTERTFSLITSLEELGMGCVFAVTPNSVEDFDGCIAVSFGEIHGVTFPVQIGEKRCTWIWPKYKKHSARAQYRLAEERSLIFNGDWTSVYLTRWENEPVVVKEVKLTIGSHALYEEKRKIEIRKLTCLMLQLKRLNHDNVVRFTGYQVSRADYNCPSSFQIIMEYLEGGTLKEVVSSSDRSFLQIHDWAHSILCGLIYLHKHCIKHGHLSVDHVMFKGSEKGSGSLKIVSIGRLDSILTMSRDSQNLTTPLTPDKIQGRKTDVRDFASILVYMITRNVPKCKTQTDPLTGESIDIPELPADTPKLLLDLIQACYKKYDQRPTSESLQKYPFFSTDAYKKIYWACRAEGSIVEAATAGLSGTIQGDLSAITDRPNEQLVKKKTNKTTGCKGNKSCFII